MRKINIKFICVIIAVAIIMQACTAIYTVYMNAERPLKSFTISPAVYTAMFVAFDELYPHGEYDAKYVNKNGNHVIALNKEQRKIWREFHTTELENTIKNLYDANALRVEVDLKERRAEFWVTPEHGFSFVLAVFSVASHVAPLNMLDIVDMMGGVGMLTWTMDVLVYNQRNDELLWQCKYPDEMPNFDWEGFEISENEALI